jgi:DNA-binding MurR/RpiR family transcriptional regulator
MTRLAGALGLAGFDAMRRPAMAALAHTAAQAATQGRADAPPQESDGTITALQHAQTANVSSVAARNPPGRLQAAANAILGARQVLFLGQRASFGIAHHLRYTCDWLRAGSSLVADPAGAWSDQLAELGAGDLLVAISQAPYSVQTVEAAQQAQARGVPVLALTDNTLSPLARAATTVLLFDTASPSFFHSMTGVLALAEALMAAVAEQGGQAVLLRLTQRQQRLQDAKVYWDKPTRLRPANASH